MNNKGVLFALFFALCAGGLFSQVISINGQVYGFNSDRVLLFKKASKNLSFEGPIRDVKISLTKNGKEIACKSDNNGIYNITVPEPGNYEIKCSREGFSVVNLILKIDENSIKNKINALNFIVKRNDNSVNELGTFEVNELGISKYILGGETKKQNPDVMQSNKILIEKSVEHNNSNRSLALISSKFHTKPNETVEAELKPPTSNSVTVPNPYTKKLTELSAKLNNKNQGNVEEIKNQIQELKNELANVSGEDLAILKQQIQDAEYKLQLKEELIQSKDETIKNVKRVIMFITLFTIVLALSIFLVIYSLQQKKKFVNELSIKNNEINKINQRLVSSIKYASVIQKNLHFSKHELQAFFKGSFIYNRPKDYLSGDFYWCTEKQDDIFIVVADCTGHGVPGALLSILGQRFLQETIDQDSVLTPNEIIRKVEKKFTEAFKDQNSVEYGVELAVIRYDKKDNTIHYASNGIGLFIKSNNELKQIAPLLSENTISKNESFVRMNKGDIVFLTTDGYADQFSEKDGKKKKFNFTSLMSLFDKVSSGDLDNAENLLERTHLEWKGKMVQTDDILILGFKVN